MKAVPRNEHALDPRVSFPVAATAECVLTALAHVLVQVHVHVHVFAVVTRAQCLTALT